MKNKPSISIFFPFLNDWGTVGSLVGLAISTVKKLSDDWEIIIINDGSSRSNREALGFIIDTLNIKYQISNIKKEVKTPRGWQAGAIAKAMTPPTVEGSKRIRIIEHEKNRGYGGALRSGFAAAKKDLIFYTDCDAQYDPRELVLLMKAYKSHSARASRDDSFRIGMVNGYKIKRNDPIHRIIAGRIYHYFVKFAFKLPIRDTDCDFRLIRREVFDPSTSSGRTAVRLFEDTGTICVELVTKINQAGYRIADVPVHHFWRTSGKSQFFNFKRIFATATKLVKLWWKLIILRNFTS